MNMNYIVVNSCRMVSRRRGDDVHEGTLDGLRSLRERNEVDHSN